MPIIYTAFSKHSFYAKMLISAYVLINGYIPLNPFNNWAYFMDDMVERDLVVRGNNNLILLSDEVWVFGSIADGVYVEMKFAISKNIPIKFFSVGKKIHDIQTINITEVTFEDELLQQIELREIQKELYLLFSANN